MFFCERTTYNTEVSRISNNVGSCKPLKFSAYPYISHRENSTFIGYFIMRTLECIKKIKFIISPATT